MVKNPDREMLRELLFAEKTGEWIKMPIFEKPVALLQEQNQALAVEALKGLIVHPDTDSRIKLVSWQLLRDFNHPPTRDIAEKVEGVVIEVGLPEGTDVLAAYRDGSARYINFSGRIIVWDRPDEEVAAVCRKLMVAGQNLLPHVTPTLTHPLPVERKVHLTLLTPGGSGYVECEFQEVKMSRDNHYAPLIVGGTELMRLLVRKSREEIQSEGVAHDEG